MDKTKSKKILKNILFVILGFVIVIAGILFFMDIAMKPTPESKRNITETDAKIVVSFSDEEEERNPIIRTYKLEEYNNLDEKKFEKVMDTISGGIEGDIPAVYLKDDNDIIYMTFLKDEKEVEPDDLPNIEIEVPEEYADTAPYSGENNKIINDKLEKIDGKYGYKIKRYRIQKEKYFIDYNIIRIYYEIDGEQYISIFGLNSTNADEGTDFFENEYLDNPIEPEE